MEGPIDNPIPVSSLGPLGEGADVVLPPRDDEEPAAADRHDVVEYDLRDWTQEQYTELTEQLVLSRITHEWRGTELRIPGAHEAEVDDLIDAVDALAEVAADVEYEFAEWLPAQCDALVARLQEAGIEFVWDGVLLGVAEADEAAVDVHVLAIDPSFPVGG